MDDVADEGNTGSGGSPATADPSTVFAALAEIIYQGSDANEMYAAICVAATLVVRAATTPACWCATTIVTSPSAPATGIAQRIDDLERRGRRRPVHRCDRGGNPADRHGPHHADPCGPSWRPSWSPRHRCAGPWVFGSWSTSAKAVRSTCSATRPTSSTPRPRGRRGGAGIVRQRGHQRGRQGRRRRQPATGAAQQPRDRQGGRHVDDAARAGRRRGVRRCCGATPRP